MSDLKGLVYTWAWGVLVAAATIGVLWAFPGHGLGANLALAALAAPVAALIALVAASVVWDVIMAVFQ